MAGFLSRLFGGSAPPAPEPAQPVEYDGFRIFPAPVNDGGKWRIGARIERDIDGETMVHHLIRADILNAREEANDASVAKAKVMIDQQGDGIFT